MRKLLTLLCFFSFCTIANSQFVFAIDRTNNTTNNTPTSTTVTGVDGPCITTTTGISRGPGISSSGGGDYNSNDWSGTQADAISNGEYLQFSLTSSANIDLSSLDIRIDRSGTGPNNYSLEYSADNFATAGTVALSVTGVTSSSAQNYNTTSLPTVFSGTLSFRLYAWGASSGSGTLDIEEFSGDDGIVINGTKSEIAPVILTSFRVKPTEKANQLTWATASEINNEKFEIERSSNSKTFETIGSIEGQGNSSREVDYTFTDESPLSGSNYYRLKQVDFDGRYEYSDIVRADNTTSRINIYPTTASNSITIDMDEQQVASVIVFNQIGQTIKDMTITEMKTNIDISDLPNGIYFVQVNAQSGKEIKKIIKQ